MKTLLFSPCFYVMVLGGGGLHIHELWRWCFGIYITPFSKRIRKKRSKEGEGEREGGGEMEFLGVEAM